MGRNYESTFYAGWPALADTVLPLWYSPQALQKVLQGYAGSVLRQDAPHPGFSGAWPEPLCTDQLLVRDFPQHHRSFPDYSGRWQRSDPPLLAGVVLVPEPECRFVSPLNPDPADTVYLPAGSTGQFFLDPAPT